MTSCHARYKPQSLFIIDDDTKDKFTFLTHNTEPWSKIIQYWIDTRIARENTMQKLNMFEILETYKIICQPLGWQLAEEDFKMMYPGKSKLLLTSWPSLAPTLWNIILENKPKALEGEYQGTSSDLKLFHSLMFLLPPLNRRIGHKTQRSSIIEAQEAFIHSLSSEDNIKDMLEEKQKEAKISGKSMQPIIIIKDDKYFVCLNHAIYEVLSLVKAFDILFKISMAFNLEYSTENKNILLFLQKYVFEISTPYDKVRK